MSSIPEDETLSERETASHGEAEAGGAIAPPLESEALLTEVPLAGSPFPETDGALADEFEPAQAPDGMLETVPPMFQQFTQTVARPPARIPNFAHFLLLMVILIGGFVGAVLLILLALHFRLYGVTNIQGTATEIHYTLGSEGLIYLFTLLGSMAIFPLLWHKSFFAGIQWNAGAAKRQWKWLLGTAFVCFLLALLNSWALPGPSHAPIEKIFREPGAAWLLFAFGITAAPFSEEIFFRGFLLPSLCTAYDWIAEQMYNVPERPLGENGHPQWSFGAMAAGAVLTSLPFAGMHAAQTGYSLGPFLLLVGVSIVLCAVRLSTRSLASSTLVHASYNFMLFAIMLVGTGGFRHLDRM
jgi:membrane protease YdiL (CAAX protease family)